VSGVVTEHGRIGCDSVLLAGGVWSGLFARNLDIRVPQLKIKCTIMRTEPMDVNFDHSVSGNGFLIRKRLDGGYNITRSGGENMEIVPDSFRFLSDYLPIARMHGMQLRYRLGRSFLDEARRPSHWSLDTRTAFEETRVLDPEPYQKNLDEAHERLCATFPVFRNARIAEKWAGMIDVTPDAVPVITPVERYPGFFIATGFSGHGFGIGPAAGRLAADLITGGTPIVDPAPFHLSRLDRPAEPSPTAAL
jgi:glycine/D-amino acid oxidase-like deaminating enzyme